MSLASQLIEDLNALTYPFEHMLKQASGKPAGATKGPGREKNDKATGQVRAKRDLRVGHVESPIEQQVSAWQPQGRHIGVAKNQAPKHPESESMKDKRAKNRAVKTELCARSDSARERQNLVHPDAGNATAGGVGEHVGTEQAEENTVVGENSVLDGNSAGQAPFVIFTDAEACLLQNWAKPTYNQPTLFEMLVQIAVEGQREGIHRPVSTETLLAKTVLEPQRIRPEVFRHLNRAWDLGLLTRAGEAGKNNGAGSVWTLTQDGKVFLVSGLRARINTRKVSRHSDEQICQYMAEDEIGDWLMELRERNRLLTSERADGQGAGAATQANKRRKRLEGSTDAQLTSAKAVSRTQVVDAIERKAVSQAKRTEPGVGPMWSALVR